MATANELSNLSQMLSDAQQSMLGFAPEWPGNLISSMMSASDKYPPYNLIKESDDEYTINVACAGFAMDELEVTKKDQTLIISGVKRYTLNSSDEARRKAAYVHRGIATRNFVKTFLLSDYTDVKEAKYENGILTVKVVRELPPEVAPKRIEILQQ